MKYVAYGFIIGYAAKDWKWRKVIYKRHLNQLRAKCWPITAGLEARYEARNLDNTFPQEWLDV